MKWQTQSGEILEIKDMETSHIQNCIRMLERLLATKPPETAYMGTSEYAQDACDQEDRINRQKAEQVEEMIRSFRAELRLREKGKPVGEDFPLPVIQRWEIDHFRDLEFD